MKQLVRDDDNNNKMIQKPCLNYCGGLKRMEEPIKISIEKVTWQQNIRTD